MLCLCLVCASLNCDKPRATHHGRATTAVVAPRVLTGRGAIAHATVVAAAEGGFYAGDVPPAPAGMQWWEYLPDVPPLPTPAEILGANYSR